MFFCTRNRIRTCTDLRQLDPESSVSTNFTIRAILNLLFLIFYLIFFKNSFPIPDLRYFCHLEFRVYVKTNKLTLTEEHSDRYNFTILAFIYQPELPLFFSFLILLSSGCISLLPGISFAIIMSVTVTGHFDVAILGSPKSIVALQNVALTTPGAK